MTHIGRPEKILTGEWDDNTSWEFHLGRNLPDEAICTSVSCLAILNAGMELVLTRNRRGWEMPGGHIEPAETLEQTLRRECMEEAGFYPTTYEQYGYRRVSSRIPVVNEHHGGTYPNVTHIVHYLAETDRPLLEPSGPKDEIFERRIFTLPQAEELTIVQLPFILAGVNAYQSILAEGRRVGES